MIPESRRKAFYSEELGEFLLRYEDVRSASSPEQALLEFLQSTYEAGATLAQWDRRRSKGASYENDQLTAPVFSSTIILNLR